MEKLVLILLLTISASSWGLGGEDLCQFPIPGKELSDYCDKGDVLLIKGNTRVGSVRDPTRMHANLYSAMYCEIDSIRVFPNDDDSQSVICRYTGETRKIKY